MANFNLPAVPTTPEGGLAGFFRGTQYNYGLADLDRQFRDSDLQNLRNQNIYENELLDNPNKVANRATDLLKQEEEQFQYSSGMKRDAAQTDLSNKKLEGKSRELLNRKEEIIQASDYLTRLQQEMLINDLSITSNWEAIKKEMKDLKIRAPEGPYDQRAKDTIHAMAEASKNSVAHLRALEIQDTKADAAFELGKLRAETSRENTRTLAERPTGSQVPANVINNAARLEIQQTGAISEGTLAAVAETMIKNDPAELDRRLRVIQEQLRNDIATGKLPQTANIALLAKDRAKQELLEEGTIAAWRQLGKPNIKGEDLSKMVRSVPSFVATYASERSSPDKAPIAAPAKTPMPSTPYEAPKSAVKGKIGGLGTADVSSQKGETITMPENFDAQEIAAFKKNGFSNDQQIAYSQLMAQNWNRVATGNVTKDQLRDAIIQLILERSGKKSTESSNGKSSD